jgi:hypothetical protein
MFEARPRRPFAIDASAVAERYGRAREMPPGRPRSYTRFLFEVEGEAGRGRLVLGLRKELGSGRTLCDRVRVLRLPLRERS